MCQPTPGRVRAVIAPSRGLAALFPCLAAAMVACGSPDDPTPDDGRDAAASDADSPPSDEDMGFLEALGYVEFGAGGETSASGVVQRDEEAWDGVNLYLSLPDAAAFLIDMDGDVLHTWSDESGQDTRWSRVEPLPGGDLLCISPKENFLIRKSWSGEEVWRTSIDAHHDVRHVDGEIYVLTRSSRAIPAVHPTRLCVDNEITRMTMDGEVVSQHSLYDILSTEPSLPIESPPEIEAAPPEARVDPMHANTLEVLTDEALAARHPIYTVGHVLVTLRYTCVAAILDLDSMSVVWAWGLDELEGPHDATLLANGNILLLDNGWEARGYSRVLEIDPIERSIVWEHKAPNPPDFFTAGRGTVQRLPNDNVLVGNSNSGEAFEVTRDGRMVWRFLNPSLDARGGRGVLRIRRFPRERFAGLLDD